VGKLHFSQCVMGNPCTIEVLASNTSWRGFVSMSPTGGFTTKLTNVTAGEAYLEAKLSAADVPAGGTIGELYLLVSQDGQSRLIGVDLQLVGDAPVTVCPAIQNTGTFQMTCSP
jgi:hypothetical protein